ERASIGQFADFGRDLQGDAVLRQHHRRKGETDAKLFELNRHVAVAIARCRNRKLTTGKKLRSLTGDGREIRFSQRVDQTDLLERLKLTLDVVLNHAGAAGERIG